MPKRLLIVKKRAGVRVKRVPQLKDPVVQFLEEFGYLKKGVTARTAADVADGIGRLQRYYRLPVTGEIDDATRKLLEQPRCGNPDRLFFSDKDTQRPDGFSGCSYQGFVRTITYSFANATGDIPGDGERDAIRRALASWAAVTNIDFVEVTTANAHFSFGWYFGDHGDGSPFDGQGGVNPAGEFKNVLAHAFYPPPCGGPHAGCCHFDETEPWSLNPAPDECDLESVALHEIGHLLGLQHTDNRDAVMYAYYRTGSKVRKLTPPDIAAIQAIYGTKGIALRLLVHLEDFGDIRCIDNQFGGTRGQSRRLEGFQIEIAAPIQGLTLNYTAHLEGIGDTPAIIEGQFCGTRGEGRRLEGFAINLSGPLTAQFSVAYMAHLEGLGDTPLMRDGAFCGTRGQSRRLEGMLVRIERR